MLAFVTFFQGGHFLVAGILGTPPISEPDTNLATVDWRFRANWSLETTFGDKGLLQADAVWQKRY